MGISQRDCFVFNVLLLFTILLASSQVMEASRVMKGEKWIEKKEKEDHNIHRLFVLPIIQVLQRAPVPPSGRNPCTNIPGQSNGRCTLQMMNVAGGHFVHAPPAIPDSALVLDFAAQSSWCLFDDDDGIEPWGGCDYHLHETEKFFLIVLYIYFFYIFCLGVSKELVASHVI